MHFIIREGGPCGPPAIIFFFKKKRTDTHTNTQVRAENSCNKGLIL